jgi:hypothetical protein
MTLVVVPVLYTYFDTWGAKASAWFKRGANASSVHTHAPTHVAGGGSIEPMPAARKDDD